jgi:di/tricarboxylate transporter
MEPLGFFEFLNVGLIISGVGILYMIFIGQFFLPERKAASYTEDYEIRQYLTEIVVTENSKLVGQNVFTSDLSKKDIRVVKIIRNKEEFIPFRSSSINAQDILLVECKIEDLIKIKETSGIEILADVITDKELQGDKIKLAEVLITPTSNIINKSLKESKFRLTHDLVVLAIHRLDENITSKIGNVSIKTGDLLLIQGSNENIENLRAVPGFRVLGNFQINKFREQKGIITGLIFIMAVLAGSFELAPLSVCFLTASLFTVMIGAISAERVYRLVEWRLLILIGGMTAFGTAMQKSGAAEFLAQQIINIFGHYGVMYVLSAFVVLVVLLTQPLSNAAAALVVLPVALNAAKLMHVNPRTFAIAIMLSASISLITPFEPSCILVYGPGKYKFVDFLKTGSILTFILVVIIIFLVPQFWPL